MVYSDTGDFRFRDNEDGTLDVEEVLSGTTVATLTDSGGMSVPNGPVTQGKDPSGPITETSSPKSFTFTAGLHRDVHKQTDVTISNSTSSSVTEDITVELYDGVDTSGTLLLSETISLSVASNSSLTQTFIPSERNLDTGDYHINVTQSGTTLTVDQTDEVARGGEYSFDQTATGDLTLTNHDNDSILNVDAISNKVEIPSGHLQLSTDYGEIQDANGDPRLSMNHSTGTTTYFSQQGGDVQFYDAQNSAYLMRVYSGGNVEVPNGNLRLATGQSIEDGDGSNRVSFASSYTKIHNEDGQNPGIELNNDTHLQLRAAYQAPLVVYDNYGSFDAVKYLPNDSVPGIFETTNSELQTNHGIKVEGSTRHSYAGIAAGANANNGHLMLDSNGGHLYLNWDENNDIRLQGSKVQVSSWLDMSGNTINYNSASQSSNGVGPTNASHIQFVNQEHSYIPGDKALGFDHSEGGGGSAGGFIYNDYNGNNNWLVNSSHQAFDIQVNGSDGSGIINFKT